MPHPAPHRRTAGLPRTQAARTAAPTAAQVAEAEDLLAGFRPSSTEDEAAAERARWLIEELRVSLFAQKLGTSVKVSIPRIRKLLG